MICFLDIYNYIIAAAPEGATWTGNNTATYTQNLEPQYCKYYIKFFVFEGIYMYSPSANSGLRYFSTHDFQILKVEHLTIKNGEIL